MLLRNLLVFNDGWLDAQ